jgi:hypothetical protein
MQRVLPATRQAGYISTPLLTLAYCSSSLTISKMSTPSVEPCFRCHHLAELPTIAKGHVARQGQCHLPLCQPCLELLLADAEAFWRPLRQPRAVDGDT